MASQETLAPPVSHFLDLKPSPPCVLACFVKVLGHRSMDTQMASLPSQYKSATWTTVVMDIQLWLNFEFRVIQKYSGPHLLMELIASPNATCGFSGGRSKGDSVLLQTKQSKL